VGESKAGGTGVGDDVVMSEDTLSGGNIPSVTGKRKLSDTGTDSPGAPPAHATTPAAPPQPLPLPQGPGSGNGAGHGLNANANASGGLLSGITGAAGATAQRNAPVPAAAAAAAAAAPVATVAPVAAPVAAAAASSSSSSSAYSSSVRPYTTQSSGAVVSTENLDPAALRALQVKERHRECNKLVARKTRVKKKLELEALLYSHVQMKSSNHALRNILKVRPISSLSGSLSRPLSRPLSHLHLGPYIDSYLGPYLNRQ